MLKPSDNLSKWFELVPTLSYMLKVSSSENLNAEVLPPNPLRALELVAPNSVRVVLVGSQPYQVPGRANGLAFGVADGHKTSSLKAFEAELGAEIKDLTLESWAKQGVLLLNTVMTTEDEEPGFHRNIGWQVEIRDILVSVLNHSPHAAWLLMGAVSQAIAVDAGVEIGEPGVFTTSLPTVKKGSNPFSGSKVFWKIDQFTMLQSEYVSMEEHPKIDWVNKASISTE
jgi:uracil DNA glycosylase